MTALSLQELGGGKFDLTVFEGPPDSSISPTTRTRRKRSSRDPQPASCSSRTGGRRRSCRGRNGGAELVAAGYIPLADLAASLDATEADPVVLSRARRRTMPGLLRGVARTAVVAGTATAVSNRVSRRQANRGWIRTNSSTPSNPSSPSTTSPAAAVRPACAAGRFRPDPAAEGARALRTRGS